MGGNAFEARVRKFRGSWAGARFGISGIRVLHAKVTMRPIPGNRYFSDIKELAAVSHEVAVTI